jgi:hypothetical protein
MTACTNRTLSHPPGDPQTQKPGNGARRRFGRREMAGDGHGTSRNPAAELSPPAPTPHHPRARSASTLPEREARALSPSAKREHSPRARSASSLPEREARALSPSAKRELPPRARSASTLPEREARAHSPSAKRELSPRARSASSLPEREARALSPSAKRELSPRARSASSLSLPKLRNFASGKRANGVVARAVARNELLFVSTTNRRHAPFPRFPS